MKRLWKSWFVVVIALFTGVFSIVKADTRNTESIEVKFKPETKRMNVGAKESVYLHINGIETQNFILKLHSSNAKVVSPSYDSKKFITSGSSINDIKIIAKREGSATITATIVRPPLAETFDGRKELPNIIGKEPILLPSEEFESLKKENGFENVHAKMMHKFAQVKGLFLIMRDGNPDSVKHFGDPRYMPKPMSCKAKTAKVGPDKGLVVNPMHPKQKRYWDDAIKKADDATELEEQRKKAEKTWKDYNASMLDYGYRTNEETGVIEYEKSGKVWYGIHGDYDLHGVYRKTGDDTAEGISYGDGVDSSNGQAFRSQLNIWLTGYKPKDFIQHGGQDDWKPDPKKVPVKASDPPAVVFFPDGRSPKRLANEKEMKHFYEYEMGIRWPYKTDDEDKNELKAELSIKVVNLDNDLPKLPENNKPKLLEESKKNIGKLQIEKRKADKLLKLPERYDENDYADVYIDASFKEAAEILKLPESSLPASEGYALLPSSDVFKSINKDRNFTSALNEVIEQIDFQLSTKETLNSKDVKASITAIKNLKSQIIQEYKRQEAEIIDKAFSAFVTKIIREYPETDMRERLISIQAFYDLYKTKRKQIDNLINREVKAREPLIKKLILAKQLVNGAVVFYKDGPASFLKVLVYTGVKKGCYSAFDYVDDTFVMAGANTAGPVGAFVGYAVLQATAYGVCDIMISAILESLENYFDNSEGLEKYTEDTKIIKWVKIFYTGNVDVVDKSLPYNVNFFSRYGFARAEILDKIENPEKLHRALNMHLTNLWNKQPELREYLDIKGDIRDIDWDNEKGKKIWEVIFRVAHEDLAAAIQADIKNIQKPPRDTMDIEKYFVDEPQESWFGVSKSNGSMLSKILVERPMMVNKQNIPEEFSIGDVVNINMRFLLLGYAGYDEKIAVEWAVRQTGWLSDVPIKEKSENITIVFSEKEIKDVKKHIKLKESKFNFTIDKESFNPETSYYLDVTLKNASNILRRFKLPFKIKSDEDKDKNSTIEILSQLNHNKLDALLTRIGGKNAPKEFYNCLCAKHPYFKTTNMGLSYHPEKAPFSPICNQVGAPCMAHGYGCTRYSFPDGAEIWSDCMNKKKYEDNTTIVDAIYDELENIP